MQNLLVGILLGYGAYYLFNTSNGKGVIRSTRTAVGQIDKKLNKALSPKEEKVEEKIEPLQIK